MAAAVELPSFQPITYIYTHLHDSIRGELDSLAQSVLQLESLPGQQHAQQAQHQAEEPAAAGADGPQQQLQRLRERYHFLEQIYKYHSSVEDQVVYPALDSKVRNVTLAYSIEHEDEEQLFEQLAQLLSRALQVEGGSSAPGGGSESIAGVAEQQQQQAATLRLLACKVEEIHTTLRKHLAKEEEQLLPLLLQHFSQEEQAELVAQFFCCIPLATVQPVLAWLKQTVPKAEQEALLGHVQQVVSDRLLQQLLVSWLAPIGWPAGSAEAAQVAAAAAAAGPAGPHAVGSSSQFVCCKDAANGTCPHASDRTAAGLAPSSKPPLKEIIYFHQAIRSALHSFAAETRALQSAGGGSVTPAQLTALVERHRFIRAVCSFHSASEDEVVFPVLKRIAQHQQQQQQRYGEAPAGSSHAGHGSAAAAAAVAAGVGAHAGHRHSCEDDHNEEIAKLEELGRLLGDVKACARRNSKELAALVADLAEVAEGLSKAMSRHMAREEAEVLPVLMRTLCVGEQRHMVWQVLRAMPLRLLERVMPWVAGKLRDDDVREWLVNIQLAAPKEDAPLVELLCQWARRGKHLPPLANGARSASRGSNDDPSLYPNHTCGPASFLSAATLAAAGQLDVSEPMEVQYAGASPAGQQVQPNLKRIRTADAARAAQDGTGTLPGQRASHQDACSGRHMQQHQAEEHQGSSAAAVAAARLGGDSTPIDHIFQFHKALRRELRDLEAAAVELHAATDEASRCSCEQVLPSVEARFQFLRGIYRAHSHAEDHIVFPALERKDALINISHSYTLDHKQEEQLFDDVQKVLGDVRSAVDRAQLRHHTAQLSRMCAAIRASLETHLRAEEKELWPVFAEHFSTEEQEHLVGLIIGSTGAEVLHSMLSWVQGSMTQDEQEAMMLSLKSASKSTSFEQWLDVALGPAQPGSPRPGHAVTAAAAAAAALGGASGSGASDTHHHHTVQEEMQATLAEVAQYLAKQGITSGSGGTAVGSSAGPSDPGSLAADSTQFRPGWEDIFRMNQKQLEAAIRRVSSDATLEPQRKAYLIQNIMASRYIVAQQRRLNMQSDSGLGSTPTAAAAATAAGTAAPGLLLGPGASKLHSSSSGGSPEIGASPIAAQQQQQQQHQGQQQHTAGKSYHSAAEGVLGCRHYKRRCRLVAPCCGTAHVCRLCHDEASDHQLDRYAVTEMICMECDTRQPVAASCSTCGTSMARYYCSICHLFDDEPGRDIYHCPFCNFCRQGKGLGVDSFHCMACNACMSLELFNRHACKEQSLQGTCPVCSDCLFESKHPIKELPCGHFMHSHCFGAYTRYSYTCPICFKSLGDMAVYWRMIDSLLAAEKLPAEYAGRKQTVLCNDCGAVGTAPFHFVYHKCAAPACGSYNTRVVE